ncbi:hypothetical protein F5Y09DRAFT_350629, partial [Xylaria sp. FL1042]
AIRISYTYYFIIHHTSYPPSSRRHRSPTHHILTMAGNENNGDWPGNTNVPDLRKTSSPRPFFARFADAFQRDPEDLKVWACGHYTWTEDGRPFDWNVATDDIGLFGLQGLPQSDLGRTCPSCVINSCLKRVQAIRTCFEDLLQKQYAEYASRRSYTDAQEASFRGSGRQSLSTFDQEITKEFARLINPVAVQQGWLSSEHMLGFLCEIVCSPENPLGLHSPLSPIVNESEIWQRKYTRELD